MDAKQEIEMLVHAISTQTARFDAMAAALAGVLEAARDNPEVVKAVSFRLDQEFTLQKAKGESDHYMKNFEVMRDYLRKIIE